MLWSHSQWKWYETRSGAYRGACKPFLPNKWTGVATVFVWFEVDTYVDSWLQQHFGTLTDAMERAYKLAGGRKSSGQASQYRCNRLTKKKENCLDLAKKAHSKSVDVSHLDISKQLCIFTDKIESSLGSSDNAGSETRQNKSMEGQDH